MSKVSKRSFLFALLVVAHFAAGSALAKDGDSGGDSSGSGSDSSGSGSGSNDDGDNDNKSDDDSRDDNEDHGDDSSGRDFKRNGKDHERAISAVSKGKAVSLKRLKEHLSQNYPGKILDIDLRKSSGRYFYDIRILAKGNRIKTLWLNALTLKPRGD